MYILHTKQPAGYTCLKTVLVPDPCRPSNRSFWTLFCSKYSGTDLLENIDVSSLGPVACPRGVGNENNEHIRRVDAYLANTIQYMLSN